VIVVMNSVVIAFSGVQEMTVRANTALCIAPRNYIFA
jgi:hypothetical protein